MRVNRTSAMVTVGLVVFAATASVILLIKGDNASPANELNEVAVVAQQESSYLRSDHAGVDVALRSCDHDTDATQDKDCFVLDRFSSGTTVTMRCWRDTVPPPEYIHPRWFYVTIGEQDHLHPGWSGWVYAELVENQTNVPQCTSDILSAFPLPNIKPLRFDLQPGDCTTSGGTLTAATSGFTPGKTYSVIVVHDDSGWVVSADSEQSGTVASNGTLPWKFPCDLDNEQTLRIEVTAYDEGSNRSISDWLEIQPRPPASGPTTEHQMPTPDAPTATQPPPPATWVITVANKTTNGPTQMREDPEPAYLSTATTNSCRTKGCKLDGTELSTGAQLTATCVIHGDRTTNGNDHDTIDDSNPELYESTLWYGARWADGRFGYISEVWISSPDRGAHGLPGC